MLYLVGGASRAGKSTLAARLCAEHGVPWFGLDLLRMGLYRGAPSLGIHPEADDLDEADRLWPIVREMIDRLLDGGRDYLIEGVCLRPTTVADLMAERPDLVQACFLGYPDLAAPQKAAEIARYAGAPGDWLSEKGEAYVLRYAEAGREASLRLRTACQAAGVAFFDTGADSAAGIAAAVQHLLGGA